MNHYKKNGLLVATCTCDWKCLKEQDLPIDICQNCHTSNMENKLISVEDLIEKYNNNLLSSCIVFAGLEPMLQFDEIYGFIKSFRENNLDEILIYTGYYPEEIKQELLKLKQFKNIIVKFGRYVPSLESVYDPVLGITLVSSNQFAERIS